MLAFFPQALFFFTHNHPFSFPLPQWLTVSHFIMLALILTFALLHSGLAALRMWGERIIGARLYRLLFAAVSIPMATILIIYFVNHRYDGLVLWQLQGVRGLGS